MKKNGWGLIGTGRIAEDRILPGINEHKGNRLVGVVSRDQGRAEAFAKKFGAQHAYTSYDELLRDPTSRWLRSTRRTRSTRDQPSRPRARARQGSAASPMPPPAP